MRSSTSLLGRTLLWIASEMLEILTIIFRIIFNDNPCRPCVPWMFSCFARNLWGKSFLRCCFARNLFKFRLRSDD